MTQALYEPGFIRMHEVLGRTYNNPLGESPFPLLHRLLAQRTPPRVLDAGCGRGSSACWWAARAGATVDAFDPSPAMLASAREAVSLQALENQVRLYETDIAGFGSEAQYDLVLAHDVLCYSPRLPQDYERLLSFSRPGGLASLSGYHAEGSTDEVRAVAASWGIETPPTFGELRELLPRPGVEALLLLNTTAQYESHWVEVQQRLTARVLEAERVVGREEAAAFAARIDAILTAVRGGRFGHWWAVVAA